MSTAYPRPTRRMFGYFSDDAVLPRELRNQNLFYSTDEDYLYCVSVNKPVLLSQAKSLVPKGLIVEDYQVLVRSDVGGNEFLGGLTLKGKAKAIGLAAAVILMLAVNVYAVGFMGR